MHLLIEIPASSNLSWFLKQNEVLDIIIAN